MKKILAIILLLIHTAASSGTVLSAHYCMGDFAGIIIGHNNDKPEHCSTCGMKDMGCCHDEPQLIKLDNTDIQKTSVAIPDFKFSVPTFQQPLSSFSTFLPRAHHYNFSLLYAGRPPTYKLNCVFRI